MEGFGEIQKNEEEKAEELREILRKSSEGEDILELHERLVEFVENLREKYPNLDSYLLYHILVGSTPKKKHEMKFDLPDGEIEKFIRSL